MSGRISNWLSDGDYNFIINDANAMTSVLAGWQVQGIGDFNGDGRDDLLVRSGVTVDWLFGSPTGGWSWAGDGGMAASTDWHVAGTGDFNGDGRDDILWRNANGALSNWLRLEGGGFTINDANAFVHVPPNGRSSGSATTTATAATTSCGATPTTARSATGWRPPPAAGSSTTPMRSPSSRRPGPSSPIRRVWVNGIIEL